MNGNLSDDSKDFEKKKLKKENSRLNLWPEMLSYTI